MFLYISVALLIYNYIYGAFGSLICFLEIKVKYLD